MLILCSLDSQVDVTLKEKEQKESRKNRVSCKIHYIISRIDNNLDDVLHCAPLEKTFC